MDAMKWTELSSGDEINSAPTIKNHSVTHFNNYLFCFGGYDGRRNHMTLLLYSISNQRWIRPHHDDYPGDMNFIVSGNPPPGRNGHSATLAAEDDENGRIIIIGGWLGTGPLAASDMHVLDVSNGGKQLRWYQPAIKGTPPGPCNMHSADYVRDRKEVYVFRGGNGREYLNDLHALHVETFLWREVETNGTPPQQRANHSSAMLEKTGELFIFGGWNGQRRLNDIHILDTKTSTWSTPRVGGVLPRPRAGMTLTALRGRLYLFGGSGTAAKCFQDLQILDREQMTWLDVTATGQDEHPNQSPDEETNQFGGVDGTSSPLFPEDSHFMTSPNMATFTGGRADWQSRDMSMRPRQRELWHGSPNPNDEDSVPTVKIQGEGPGRRAGHTATAVNRKIYVFGGSCGSDYLNDFFVLDTDPPPTASVTLPSTLQLLERRLRHFFNDEEFSDVTFVVQGRNVYGHKMILSIVSDCFRAMFTTGFRESDQMVIDIHDTSHDAFLAVMEYIYKGKTRTEDVDLNRVVEIMELADRYFLDHLKQICETTLQAAVSPMTVEFLLSVAQKSNANQLQVICEHFLRNRETNA